MQFRRREIGSIIAFVAVLSILGLVLLRFTIASPTQRNIHLATAKPKSFDVQVNTVGTLDAARSHMVSSTIRGDKGKIIFLVDDGQPVEEDDVLVKLDPTPFEEEVNRLRGERQSLGASVEANEQILEWEKNQVERELSTAEYNLKVAHLDLKKLVEGDGPLQTTQYKDDMDRVREEYTRYLAYIKDLEQLAEQGFGNPTELSLANQKSAELEEKFNAAEKKFISFKEHVLPSLEESARARVEQSEMELEQTTKGSVFKIAKAISTLNEVKGKLEASEAALRQAETELDKTIINAPFGGIAILYEAFRDGQKRKPRVGDRVWQNQPLLYLPDISGIIVKTQVREVDLHKIALEQECLIKVDAYPDIAFNGDVNFIGVLAAERNEGSSGEKCFQVTVAMTNNDPRLRPGMTARVSTLTDQVSDVLCVPVQAIFSEAGEHYCYRHRKGRFLKTGVSTGRTNDDLAEITKGLEAGDQVSLIKPADDLVDTAPNPSPSSTDPS